MICSKTLFRMQCYRLLICSALAIIFFNMQVPSFAEKTLILEGKIEHADALPPVSSQWKTGSKFDVQSLPVTGSQSAVWWQVPAWLSGTWRNVGQVKRLSLKDYQHAEANAGFSTVDVKYPDSEVIGYQEDRHGSIWTCVPTPYVGRTEQAQHMNVSIIHMSTPISITDQEVILKFLATTLMIDKSTGKIENVTQREALQTYRPIDANHIFVQASMKFFDENGSPRYESKVISQCKLQNGYKETPYLPVPGSEPTLIDLRKSFDQYLRFKMLDALIPQRLPLLAVPGYKMITLTYN